MKYLQAIRQSPNVRATERKADALIDKWARMRYYSSTTERTVVGVSTWLAVFLVYGFAEAFFTSVWLTRLKHNAQVPFSYTIINLIFMAILVGFLGYATHHVQSRYVDLRHVHHIGSTKSILWGLGLVIVPLVVAMALAMLGHVVMKPASNQLFLDRMMSSPSSLVWLIVMTCLIGPCAEEITYRFLWVGPSHIRGRKYSQRKRWFLIVTGILFFMFEHMASQYFATDWLDYQSAGRAVVSSAQYIIPAISLMYWYVHDNNIWSSVKVHTALNAIVDIIGVMTII